MSSRIASGKGLPKRPSMPDVARVAGCSLAAVSYAFNGNGRLSKKKRAEILSVCKKIGYIPNAAGRSLRVGRSSAVGLLFYPSCAHIFGNPFYAEVMGPFEEVLVKEGFHLLMAGYDFSVNQKILPRFLTEQAVDGCVLVGAYPSKFLPLIKGRGVPLLLLDGSTSVSQVDSISSDGFEAGRLLAHHFAKLGHKRIGVLRTEYEDSNSDDRIAGFSTGLREAGLELPQSCIVQVRAENAAELSLRLVSAPLRCTGLFAINDAMAYLVWKSLESAGLAIPDDVSLAGFDDLVPAGATTRPLTTFRVDRKQIGREGAHLILKRLKERNALPQRFIVDTEFVDRGSVGPAPKKA